MSAYQKFNFVFLLPWDVEYYNLSLFDLNDLLNVRIIAVQYSFDKNGNLSINFFPFRSEMNPYAFKKPMNNLFFGDYFNKEFPARRPIIFYAVHSAYAWMKAIGYFNYLRSNYPDCKIVLSLTNPVNSPHQGNAALNNLLINEKNINGMNSDFDCIVTYNKNDAVRFGFIYCNGGYSRLPFKSSSETSDLFFIGWAKDRLHKIHDYYKYFKSIGLKCDFYVTGVPPERQEFPNEIHYNQKLSYLEVLNHVINSKGVLEVTQNNTYGLTMRFFEALVYDKNFVTDNGFLNQEKFLSSPKLFYIPPYSKLNIDPEKYFIVSKLSNNYKNEYSPVRLLEFLETHFNSLT